MLWLAQFWKNGKNLPLKESCLKFTVHWQRALFDMPHHMLVF